MYRQPILTCATSLASATSRAGRMAFGGGFGKAAGNDDLVIGFAQVLVRNPNCAMRSAWPARCARYARFAIAA